MKRTFAILLFVLTCTAAVAKVTLCPIFGDSMVLQRESKVKIWGLSDSGNKVSVFTSWNGKFYSCKPAPNGGWSVDVETGTAGGPYTIVVDDGDKTEITNVSLGEVWICSGQSNMEMPVRGFSGQAVENAAEYVLEADGCDVRVFTLSRSAVGTPQSSCVGEWKVSDYHTVPSFSAVAYLFAKRLQQTLKVPVGVVVSAWGGSSILGWMPSGAVSSISEDEKARVLELCGKSKDQPSVLFNGMIAPVAGYGARGFLWYQGEANVGTPQTYGKMIKAMVQAWRQAWGDRKSEMPFYAVEIAPYRYGKKCELKFDRPLTVEATVAALSSIPNAAVAPTGDVGNATVIHPAQKRQVADRLAMYALKYQYGYEMLVCVPPSVKKIEYKDGKAIITPSDALASDAEILYGFEIAGSDECYYDAKAYLDRRSGQIVLSNPNVKEPVAVRYGFRNFNRQNWRNWMGVPALPFRTEKWDYTNQQ